jgi:hypothetical protein
MAEATRKLAEEFWKELANARTGDAYKGLIKKYYADDVTQNEAGEAVSETISWFMSNCCPTKETKGLEEVLKREGYFFDNYFDWDNFPQAPTLDIHGQYVDERGVVFTDHTARLALKGTGVISEFFVFELFVNSKLYLKASVN